MPQLTLNIILGLVIGAGAVMLKLPFKRNRNISFSTYLTYFAAGFLLGFFVVPATALFKTYVLSLVLKNPMIFTTKAFKVVVGIGTAGAFLAGFKIGKWEI